MITNRASNSQHLVETPACQIPTTWGARSAEHSSSIGGGSQMAGEEWAALAATEFLPEFHMQMMPDESMLLLEQFQSSLPFLESFYESQDVKMEEESASASASASTTPIQSHGSHLQIQSSPSAFQKFHSWTNNSTGSVEDHEASCSSNPDFSGKRMFRRMMEIHSSAAHEQIRAAAAAAAIQRQEEQQEQQEQQQLALQSNAEPPRSGYNHMMAERNRRNKEKQLLGTLKSFIPCGGSKKMKGDKISTLLATIDYIKQLQHQVENLEQQNKESQAAAMKIDREDSQEMDRSSNSSEDSLSQSQTLDPAFMLTAEDDHQSSSSCSMRLRFEMHNRMKPAHEILVEILGFLKQMGLKLDSIDWLKVSSILTITVHSTTDSCPISAGQLREELERRLCSAAAPKFEEEPDS